MALLRRGDLSVTEVCLAVGCSLHRVGRAAQHLPAPDSSRDGGDAVVRRETGDQTDQESRSAGHPPAPIVDRREHLHSRSDHDRLSPTQGIKTVLHPVSDLATAKGVYAALLGVPPQTDESYYVGFEAAASTSGWCRAVDCRA